MQSRCTHKEKFLSLFFVARAPREDWITTTSATVFSLTTFIYAWSRVTGGFLSENTSTTLFNLWANTAGDCNMVMGRPFPDKYLVS